MELIFDNETLEKYPERCRLISKGYADLVADKCYLTPDIQIYVENISDREWDENLRILAGDGDDAGQWKILIPFDEYVGHVFRMHVATGFTLIIYDLIHGEGAFNKIKDPEIYQKIYNKVEPYFVELLQTYGSIKSFNVEVEDGR